MELERGESTIRGSLNSKKKPPTKIKLCILLIELQRLCLLYGIENIEFSFQKITLFDWFEKRFLKI